MNLKKLALTAALAIFTSALPCSAIAQSDSPNLIPWPKTLATNQGTLKLRADLTIAATDPSLAPLATLLASEINAVAPLHAAATSDTNADIVLKLSPQDNPETYELTIDDRITLTGSSYQSIAEGSATILQAITTENGSAEIQRMKITDRADTGYRGLMIDLARNFHPISNLEQIIEMCRFYKIRYLHLHLSDDQAFTFPSRAFPNLATKNRSYSQTEMQDLVKYAHDRGVTIVPEIDMPAHASAIIHAMPELSSPGGGNVINFADPKCVAAACTLVDEMAEMFPESPYIHIGGDEADIGRMASAPAVVKAIADQKVGDINGLFNYFLNQLDARIKTHGKRAIVWEGFSIRPSGPAQVNPDVIVEPFDNYSNVQQTYVTAGHDLINTSWFPMYVVRDVLFGPKSIYDWNIYTFGNYRGFSPRNFQDVRQYQVTSHEKVLGAQVCSWEQGPETEIPTLRRRLAAMADRAWNRSSTLPYENFARRLDATDAMLSQLLTTKAPGRVLPAASDSVYADRVVIQWNPADEFPTKYTVLRGDTSDPASATPIAPDITATQYIDHPPAEGKPYFYWVKAANRFGYGPLAEPVRGSRGTSTKIVSAYDGFNYPPDTSWSTADGGDGWTGPWQISKAEAKIAFKSQGLTYPGLKTSGGCLNIQFSHDKDMVDVHRPTAGIQGVPGTQMWMSYLIRANKIGDGHFLATSDAAGVTIGKQWGNGICIFGYPTNVALKPGETYLVVARFDCMTPHDTVYVWVNPPLDKEPDPNTPGTAIDTLASSTTGHKFGFSSQGYGEGDYDFDEIRLGSTWQEVMPQK